MPRATSFTPTPSLASAHQVAVDVAAAAPRDATAVGIPVPASGDVPEAIGVDRAGLTAMGFTAEVGQTIVLPGADGRVLVAVGVGAPAALGLDGLRDAAAAFARAASGHARLATSLAATGSGNPSAAAHAVVEGVILARYRYETLRTSAKGTALRALTLVAAPAEQAATAEGARRGAVFAAAQALARDLANTPHSHLTASRFAELAQALGGARGLEVAICDRDALIELGCGGLLAINAGSAQPPRMITLTYRPDGAPSGRLALVGKGVMYDSGGISLKPSNRVHAQMKNDMSGAAAVLAAMLALRELGCRAEVTGYLMCTDNMPSGTATGLGDVITIRGGKTVEMIDTDAEGRVILADALVLAREAGHDAIVDIATLTGSAARALGPDMAAVFATHEPLLARVEAAAAATAEPVWRLPLHHRYRAKLDSLVADIANCADVGTPDAILAALFLAEFVGDVPWVHIDMCPTAQNDADRTWHPAGCTGFGARLLLHLALDFTTP